MRGEHSTFEIDVLLQTIAGTQLGLVTADQAAKAGVDKSEVYRVRRDNAKFARERRFRLGVPRPSAPGLVRHNVQCSCSRRRKGTAD